MQSKIEALKTKDKNRNLLHEKQCQAIIKASKEKQASVQKEMDKMTIQLKEMRIEHREAERVLQKVSLVHPTFHFTVNTSHLRGCYILNFNSNLHQLLFFSPWQRNARVRDEIELVIQHFDNKMEELQVRTQTKHKAHKVTGKDH